MTAYETFSERIKDLETTYETFSERIKDLEAKYVSLEEEAKRITERMNDVETETMELKRRRCRLSEYPPITIPIEEGSSMVSVTDGGVEWTFSDIALTRRRGGNDSARLVCPDYGETSITLVVDSTTRELVWFESDSARWYVTWDPETESYRHGTYESDSVDSDVHVRFKKV